MTATQAKTPTHLAADIRRRVLPLLDSVALGIGERRARQSAPTSTPTGACCIQAPQ